MTRREGARNGLVVVNPLGHSLAHYCLELGACMPREISWSRRSFPEPSVSGTGRSAWLRRYVSALLAARRQNCELVLVVWPVLGFFDAVLLRAILGRGFALVMHDSAPLSSSVGYGAMTRWIATRLIPPRRLIVHSDAAFDDLGGTRLKTRSVLLPHPVLAPRPRPCHAPVHPVLRVLGRYKDARDLGALRAIRDAIGVEVGLEVVGAGWPAVEGWTVRDSFVAEDELDTLILTSTAVVIPYRRFYQSGIALRCLELGVNVVGLRDSVLGEWFPGAPGLVDPGETSVESDRAWAHAAVRVLNAPEWAPDNGQKLHDDAKAAWAAYLASEVARDPPLSGRCAPAPRRPSRS